MKNFEDKFTPDMFDVTHNIGHQMAKLSSDRADRELGDWSDKALNLFLEFANSTSDPFLVEQARAYAEDNGLTPPPDARAWGHIVRSARRSEKIVSCGFALAKSSNHSPKVLWKLKEAA
jgi:hypothetical protein